MTAAERSESAGPGRLPRAARGVLLVMVCLCACSPAGERHREQKAAATGVQAGSVDAFRYPIGPWWRDMQTTARFTFSAAHILISHREAEPHAPFHWIAARPAPRTREQALRLALEIQNELRLDPRRFGDIARRHSDDRGSGPRGGRLGVLRAARVPHEVVDAIGHLAVGELSTVLETSVGYHVLQRMQVPDEVTVSAREIVIRYAGLRTGWPRLGRSISRGRDEAEALAVAVAAEARKDPARFPDLVQRYSDSQLAVDGGELGSWSSRDFFADGVVVDALSEVATGAIVGPLDSPAGFKILQRTPAGDRPWLVASQILIAHDASLSQSGSLKSSRSRGEAQKLVGLLLRRLKDDPSAFDALQREYFPSPTARRLWWQLGNGIPGLSRAVSGVAVGAVVAHATETPLGFHILRSERLETHPLDPRDPRAQPPIFELPDPPLPALLAFLQSTPRDRVDALIRQFRRDAIQDLGLRGAAAAAFGGVYEQVLREFPALTPEGQALRMERGSHEVAALLSTDQHARFVEFRRRWLAETSVSPN